MASSKSMALPGSIFINKSHIGLWSELDIDDDWKIVLNNLGKRMLLV